MKGSMTRRSVLAGTGCALAVTAAGQMLTAVAIAQQSVAPTAGLCMTMLFPAGAKAKFDADRYAKKHVALLREAYGDSVARIELRTAAASAMGMPSAVLATSTLWIRDVATFSQMLAANAERINKDLDAVAKGNRLVQVDRVALELGDARDAIAPEAPVYSMFYPSAAPRMRPGMRPPGAGAAAPDAGAPAAPGFDAHFFITDYLPKLHALYGPEAVRRVEATLGQDQGGQKATHLAASHLVIRDRSAFDAKSASVFSALQKDAGTFTTIFPMLADMRIHTIA